MANKFNLTVQPPLGGVKRDLAFQEQEPFTAVDCLNLWPHDPDTGREVLASRPPLAPFESPETEFIGETTVNMFCRVSGNIEGVPQQGLTCAADQQVFYWNGTTWVAAIPDSGELVVADRAVSAAPYLHWVFIANDTSMLVYNYNDNSLSTAVATAGTFPLNARVTTTFLGTLWVGGTPGQENILKGSRTGDAFDWDFTFDDAGAPFQMVGEDAGILNEAITALVPRTSDSMVVAGPTSMQIMYGHPSRGGLFEGVSSTLGILGQGAWCKLPDDTIYFMSVHGLAKLGPADGAKPELVSDTAIPESLKGIVFDQLDTKITMAYDSRFQKIYINIRGDQQQGWVFDTKSGGFFRQTFDKYPFAMLEFPPFVSFNKSGVLWGGTKDAGITRFDRLGTESSRPFYRAFIGPVKISNDSQKKSIIDRVRVVLGKNANDPRGMVAFFTGTDGEDAFTRAYNNIAVTRSLFSLEHLQANAGWCSPKISGHAMVMVISGGNAGKMIFESANMALTESGTNNMTRSIGYGYGIGEGVDFYNAGFGGGFDNYFADWGGFDVGPWSDDTTDPYSDGEHSDGVVIPGPSPALPSGYVGIAFDDIGIDSFPVFSLADMPDDFWAKVKDDGGDIRMTGDNSFETVGMHILAFDREAKTGAIKLNQADLNTVVGHGATALRLWVGTNEDLQPTSSGYDASIDDNIQGFWMNGSDTELTGLPGVITKAGSVFGNFPTGRTNLTFQAHLVGTGTIELDSEWTGDGNSNSTTAVSDLAGGDLTNSASLTASGGDPPGGGGTFDPNPDPVVVAVGSECSVTLHFNFSDNGGSPKLESFSEAAQLVDGGSIINGCLAQGNAYTSVTVDDISASVFGTWTTLGFGGGTGYLVDYLSANTLTGGFTGDIWNP